MTYNVLISDKF